MAQNLLSGKTGSTLIGGVAYGFSKWKLSMKTNLPKANNWLSAPYQVLVSGLTSATITLSALVYDAGNMPLTCGNSYVFTLQWTPALSITVTAYVESIEPDDDVDGAPSISVTAQSSGTFTAAIT